MKDQKGGKQGVILSSGGADGAYAVGVMKALFSGKSRATGYRPLNPDVIVGTSIGAFNGAFIVSHLDPDAASAVTGLERVWLEELAENPQRCSNGGFRLRVNPLTLLNPRCIFSNPVESALNLAEDSAFLTRDLIMRAADFVSSDKPLEHRSIDLLNFSSFVSSEPLLRVIENEIRFDTILHSKTALRVIATDWTRGELKVFSNEDLTAELGPTVIKASAAIPGFFPPVEIGDEIFVDGAVLGYTRLAPAIDAGADTLHVIYVDPDVENIPNETLDSTMDTMYRVFVIGWAARVNEGIDAVGRINRQLDALDGVIRKTGLSEADVIPIRQALLPSGRYKEPVIRVAVHRYHPRDDPFGPLGLLNLNPGRIESLIERGFRDAVTHDCVESNCVVSMSGEQTQAVA